MDEDIRDPGKQSPVVCGESDQERGALQSRNVRIHDHRTSVRLEPEMWAALNEIARTEKCSIHDLCGAVHDLKDPGTSFTAALRVFLMEYYRAAARPDSRVTEVQMRARATARGGFSSGEA